MGPVCAAKVDLWSLLPLQIPIDWIWKRWLGPRWRLQAAATPLTGSNRTGNEIRYHQPLVCVDGPRTRPSWVSWTSTWLWSTKPHNRWVTSEILFECGLWSPPASTAGDQLVRLGASEGLDDSRLADWAVNRLHRS